MIRRAIGRLILWFILPVKRQRAALWRALMDERKRLYETAPEISFWISSQKELDEVKARRDAWAKDNAHLIRDIEARIEAAWRLGGRA